MEGIYGTSRESITALFDELDIDRYHDDDSEGSPWCRRIMFCDHLHAEMQERFGPGAYGSTCWFHLTRVFPGQEFADGILPLRERMDQLWMDLYQLVEEELSPEAWASVRRKLDHDHDFRPRAAHAYRQRLYDDRFGGPYAVLVREAAFRYDECGNHDYLGSSETVEAICWAFEEIHGMDLLTRYRATTRPCIVKFIETSPYPERCLCPAIYYLYRIHHGLRLCRECSTCYDAGGSRITPERILEVKRVSEPSVS